MKRITYFFLFLSFVFITNSCEENGIFFPPSENNGVFEVTVDGTIFSTNEVSFTSDNENLVMTAIDTNTNEIFTLTVEDYNIGGFSFEGVNNIATYVQNDPISAGTWSTFGETASRGNIEFTNIDFVNNTISGTFSFIGKNTATGSSKAFSNGSFSNIIRSSQSISEDSFTAKVDGTVFQEMSLFANAITVGTTNLISINANKSLNETISFNLNADSTPGEYDFGSLFTQSFPSGQYIVDGNIYEADGKITIIDHDITAKKITGTFNFDAIPITSTTPVHSITEGAFSVSY
tara:strand:+ start:6812 stop:7684 length:873 start_codon:yes stop_codon:yes gene_type:complete